MHVETVLSNVGVAKVRRGVGNINSNCLVDRFAQSGIACRSDHLAIAGEGSNAMLVTSLLPSSARLVVTRILEVSFPALRVYVIRNTPVPTLTFLA